LLVVEDDPAMQATLQRSAERRGMQVTACGDGAGAGPLAASVPDAVVLDLSLPGLDGLQVLAAGPRRGLRTPVLILTARGTVGDRVLGLNTGADDYLPSPSTWTNWRPACAPGAARRPRPRRGTPQPPSSAA
jgi:two-component system response regulator TctD